MRRVWLLPLLGTAIGIAISVSVTRRRHVLPSPTDTSYSSRIQVIFDHRCVGCHACFDSPCQLNLQSFDGFDRGASKAIVYRPNRLEPMAPTRMFQDAKTTAEWQSRFDFFPVVSRDSSAALADSLLLRLVEQRRAKPLGGSFDVDASTVCPRTSHELTGELVERPEVGMPFGFPPLTDDEADAVSTWVRKGSGRPVAPSPESEADRAAIATWEAFLNGDSPKSQLVARYLYEHLFLAHIHFGDAPNDWFRLVRSRTREPAEVDEIATLRPYDDPGVSRSFYRFRRITETIVAKTHVPYRLDSAKLARVRQIFFGSEWGESPTALPSYDRKVAANPFVVFRAIPARARYQFLLDDAYYHVETFIRGPVCKGQVALNVIDEHFLIFFLSPAADRSVTDPAYLNSVARYLGVPAEGGDGVEAIYERFKLDELAYLRAQAAALHEMPGRSLADLWDGDGANRDAVLTVYRHYDNAFVLRGAVGGIPKTAWVMDYPIFERTYYNLVAGFNVFGNVIHQVSTRRYMNLLRIEGEDQFLRFLPQSERKSVRDSWYRGNGVALLLDVVDPLYGGPEPRIDFRDRGHAKSEVVRRVVTEALPERVVGARDPIQWVDVPLAGDSLGDRFDREARAVAATPGTFVQVFPDATLLRVRSSDGDRDLVFTIIRNRSHANIDFMFLENDFLVPSEDTLHVVQGFAVTRPNLFLTVSSDDLSRFFDEVRALVGGDGSWRRFVDRYGIRRSDARFWGISDFFNAEYARLDPFGAGVLDLMRYGND